MIEAYEITFILDEGSKSEGIEKALKDISAEVGNITDLGVKQFAYPIKKKTSGNYFAIEFKTEREKLVQLEKELKNEKDLVRYLIIKAMRKPIEMPRRERPEGAVDVKEKKPIIRSAHNMSDEENAEKEIKVEDKPAEKPVEAKVEEPIVEEVKAEEAPAGTIEEKTEVPAVAIAEARPEEKKPAKKPRAKAEKVSAEELDKKLEELVKE